MPKFLPLKALTDSIGFLAIQERLATDMTGGSLPILDFVPGDTAHPYRVIFLLYYAVPDVTDLKAPDKITRPYAMITLDMQTGKIVQTKRIGSEDQPNPLLGPGIDEELYKLSEQDRQNLRELFFSRYDTIAQIFPSEQVPSEQKEYVADLLTLFESLLEPPLRQDYETYGKAFFSWLREHAQAVQK